MPKGIILLEGADSSGKTTLANVFREKHGARYLHGKLFQDPWKSHLAMARYALRLASRELVVIDRHWISHLAYGQVFHNQAYDVSARCLDRALRRAAALTILCVPGDPRLQEADWRAGAAAGKVEHFRSVREVIKLYYDLARGNVAHPGEGYLDQLIRFQDFAQRDDVLIYDRYTHKGTLKSEAFVRKVLQYLAMLRESAYEPGLWSSRFNLAGRIDRHAMNGILFVAEKLSSRVPERGPRWPMTWRDSDRAAAATWFNETLHLMKLSEARVVITNADEADHHLPELLDRSGAQTVVALGNVAAQKLRYLGISYEPVPHPQWHRRFKYAEGPAGYAALLAKVIEA